MLKLIRVFILISKFQGPPALPIVGNLHKFSKDLREFFVYRQAVYEEYRARTGGIVRWWNGPKPHITIYSAKHVEAVLKCGGNMKRSFAYSFLQPWLGLGLLLSTGKKWFQRRRMLTPTFHFSILQNFMGVFNEQSNILAEKFDAFANRRDPVNIFPLATLCALDVICGTAMGKHMNAQGETDSEFVRALKGMIAIAFMRFRSPLMWVDAFFYRTEAGERQRKYLRILHGVTQSMIQQKLLQSSESPDVSTQNVGAVAEQRKQIAFLDLLIQMHREDPSFTLADVQEEVDDVMFAGHDTTAAAVSWSLYLIGLHPGIQARLLEEISEVLGDSDRHVTTDDLAKLSYLTCVVKESLRVLPPVPGMSRTLDSDIVLDGKVVPKGTSISFAIYALHRDPEQFPDPEIFDPDRFLPENSSKRHPYAYIPFAAGPRNCIGQRYAMMETKVTLVNLLRRFSFKSTQTMDDVKPTDMIVLNPEGGEIFMEISRRK
ncbi:cytochrome P450 4V2-like [Diadema antillarum]|uniref:cytochrome P450 4V2-like n=1 Tax=Diadema antillarum TaxID=105358 RepID=UPI003A8A49F7